MNLDERLDAARDEYRRLGAGAGAVLEPGPAARPPARPAPWVLSVAAVVVLVVVVAVLAWRRTDTPDPPASVDETPTVTMPTSVDPPTDADRAPLVPDPAVVLTPSGPFEDGEEVELSAPIGLVSDWSNEWPLLCATVDTDQGELSSCDHVHQLNAVPGYGGVVNGLSVGSDRDTRRIRLSRLVFTPLGYRDCADADVRCHVVIRAADGTAAASQALEFEGGSAPRVPEVVVEPGSAPGRLVVVAPEPEAVGDATGEPDGSHGWLVNVCSFGDGQPASAPDGVTWSSVTPGFAGRPGLGGNCEALARPTSAEAPLTPGSTVEVDLAGELYGYTGWSDCRRQACYAQLTPLTPVNGSMVPIESRAVATILVVPDDVEPAPRPSMTISEPAPYSEAQQISVEIAGVPPQYTGMVGVCRIDAPWQCGYVAGSSGAGPRTVTFTLAGRVTDCGPDRCFLALESGGEGLAPPAWVALPIGAGAAGPPAG